MPLLTVKNVHIIAHRKRAIALVFKMSWETWNLLSNDKMGLDNFCRSRLIKETTIEELLISTSVVGHNLMINISENSGKAAALPA